MNRYTIDNLDLFSKACEEGNIKAMDYLFEKGVDITTVFYLRDFRRAIDKSRINIIEWFLQHDIDVNSFSNFALRLACGKADFEVIKVLVENGAKVTPYIMSLAYETLNQEIISYLTSHVSND